MTQLPDPTHPWERYGWVMGAVWLVFLAFPVAGILMSGESTPKVVSALAAFAVFALVYLHGLIRLPGRVGEPGQLRVGVAHLIVMVALLVLVHVLVGAYSLGGTTYVAALAMFVLPLGAGIAVTALTALTTLLVSVWSGVLADQWFLVGIIVIVGIITTVVRVVESRAIVHDDLRAELGVVAERDRLARDVHDVIGHTLTAMTLKADLAGRLVDTDPEAARREIAEVATLSRQALAEVRSAVGGLRSAHLPEEIAAADRVLRAAGIRAEIPTDLTVVDPRHRVVLAWVLREAVTNVVRHSGARQCRITLEQRGVTVTDDGRGLSSATEGNGLRGIRERVSAAGGAVEIADARPGTIIEVRL